MARKADAGPKRRYVKVSHDVRYGFANPPWWKVIKGKPRVKCATCGDVAMKISDGKPKCGNCVEEEA